MSSAIEFNPSWASAPGETIIDLLDEKGLSLDKFSSIIGKSSAYLQKLIDGSEVIDQSIAELLTTYLGASVSFWINRENQFRTDLERIAETKKKTDQRSWLSDISVSDLIKNGWVNADRTVSSRVKACLEFFDVASIDDWYTEYKTDLQAVSFRTSDAYEHKSGAVTAWLRYGKIKAKEIKCDSWNPDLLTRSLPELRALTNEADPAVFIPKLQEICAACGVAVVVAKAPSGCRASGATTFVEDDKALLLLSFRFRADDQLWFTFFHEIGHLLMHDPNALFLEDESEVTSIEEQEANDFSASLLIPEEYQHELYSLIAPTKEWFNARKVMKFAKQLGISAGIVVGQLQHRDIIAHSRLNKLKNRYKWSDIEL